MKKTILLFTCAVFFTFPAMGQHYFGEPQDEFFGLNLSEPNNPVTSPCLADLDADGDLDLLVAKVWYNNSTTPPIPIDWSVNYYEHIGDAECPEFADPVADPFGIPEQLPWYLNLVDIDSDGDLDLFAGASFLENTGTATVPDFSISVLVTAPFGLDLTGVSGSENLTFGYIYSDTLLDVFIAGRTPDHFYFQRNIGTTEEPWFGARETDPFGLEFGEHAYGPNRVALADWDCDGDIDLLNCIWHMDLPPWPNPTFATFFHENLTVGEDILFAEGQLLEDSLLIFTQGDMDGDDDLDIMSFQYYVKNILPDCANFPQPEAKFTYAQDGLEYTFTNESDYTNTDCHLVFLWDFGDGQTSLEENPVHLYANDGTYEVCLTVDDATGYDKLCKLIVGTHEVLPVDAIRLSPNPATGYLELALDTDQALNDLTISIYDAHGRVVWEDQVDILGNETKGQIDVSSLPDGLYTLWIRSEEGVFVGRFVKE